MSYRKVLTLLTIVVGLVFGFSMPAAAQNFQVTARVQLEDGTPVKGARVYLEPEGSGLKEVRGKTRKSGEAKLPFVKYGDYKFRAEADDLLMLKIEILVEQRGNKFEYEDNVELGPDQAVPSYQIGPGREVEVVFTMVPDSHFAGILAIAGDNKLNEKLSKANEALIEGDYEKADALLGEIIEEKPDAASAHYLLGLSEAQQGDLGAAEASLRKAHEADPKLPGVAAQLGSVLYAEERREQALEWFAKEIEVSPDAAPVAINYAFVLTDLKRYEEAAEAWKRVLELKPSEANAYAELAGVYVELEREEDAIEALEKMEEIAKPSAAHWYNIGANFSNRDQFDRAVMAFTKASELDPTMALPRRELGYLLVKQGKMQEALDAFRKYLELSPDAADADQVKETITLLEGAIAQ